MYSVGTSDVVNARLWVRANSVWCALKSVLMCRRIFGYVTMRRLEGLCCVMCSLPQEPGQFLPRDALVHSAVMLQ